MTVIRKRSDIGKPKACRGFTLTGAYIFYNFQRHPTVTVPCPLPSALILRIFMQTRNFSIRMLALLLALVLTQPFALTAAQAAGTSTPTLPDPGKTGMTREQQQQLGLQAVGEVYKQM